MEGCLVVRILGEGGTNLLLDSEKLARFGESGVGEERAA